MLASQVSFSLMPPIQLFGMVTKSVLTIDELDELLNITHLEPDSRKLRRFRLLKELSKSHPFMISRVKDKDDKRRFNYKVIV